MSAMLKQWIIGLTAALGIVIIAGGAYVLLPVAYSGIAYVLPANDTLLLLHPIDQRIVETWLPSLPALQDLPAWTEGQSAALLRTPDGETEWLLFDPHTRIRSDSPVLTGSANRLSASADFVSLGLITQPDPWMFAAPDAWTQPTADQVLASPSMPIGIVRTDASWIFSRRRTLPRLAPLAASPSDHSNTATISLNASNLRITLEGLYELLHTPARTILASSIGTAAHTLFGNDLSPAYDLLPLLDGPGSMQLHTTDTETEVASTITMANADTAESTAMLLHSAYAQARPQVERIQRTFDDTFSLDAVRLRQEPVEQEVWKDGMWNVRTTGQTGASLLTAVRGAQLAIGTDPTLVSKMIAQWEQGTDRRVVATGVIDLHAATAHLPLGADLHRLAKHLLPVQGTGSISLLHWTLRQTPATDEWTVY